MTPPTLSPDTRTNDAIPVTPDPTSPRAAHWVRDLHRAIQDGQTLRVVALLAAQAHDPSLGDINEAWGEGDFSQPWSEDNRRSVRRTALHQAIGNHGGDLVRRLLNHPGIDPNGLDHAGQTPLHRVVTLTTVTDPVGLMRALLDAGADPFRRAVHRWFGPPDVPGLFRVQGRDLEGRPFDEHRLDASLAEAVVCEGRPEAGPMLDVLDRHGAIPSNPKDRWRLVELAVTTGRAIVDDRMNRCPRSAVRWLLEQHPLTMTPQEGERLLAWAAPLATPAPATFRCVEGAVLGALADHQHHPEPTAPGETNRSPRPRL